MGNKYIKYKDKHKFINDVEYKWCPDCNEWYPMDKEHFKAQPSQKDGYSKRCRTCQEKYNHEHYMDNREKQIEDAIRWKKNNREKYITSMKKTNQRPDRIEDIRLRMQQYREDGRYLEWQRNNPDKLKQYNLFKYMHKHHEITKEELNSLYQFANSECMYCGMSEEESLIKYKNKLHKDHAYNDGSNGIENCILACKGCNCSKSARDWDVWYNENNPRFDIVRYYKIIEWLNIFNNQDIT